MGAEGKGLPGGEEHHDDDEAEGDGAEDANGDKVAGDVAVVLLDMVFAAGGLGGGEGRLAGAAPFLDRVGTGKGGGGNAAAGLAWLAGGHVEMVAGWGASG